MASPPAARGGKDEEGLRFDDPLVTVAAGGGMSFSGGADERRWILPPTPRACRRCEEGDADEDAAEESRLQRDRLLCPHCSSTSPPAPTAAPPVELGEAVSEESEGWLWPWSRAGLRDDGGCGARALADAGFESGWEAARCEACREPSVGASSSLKDLDAGFRATPPLPPPFASGRQSGLSLWYLQRHRLAI